MSLSKNIFLQLILSSLVVGFALGYGLAHIHTVNEEVKLTSENQTKLSGLPIDIDILNNKVFKQWSAKASGRARAIDAKSITIGSESDNSLYAVIALTPSTVFKFGGKPSVSGGVVLKNALVTDVGMGDNISVLFNVVNGHSEADLITINK